MSQQPLALVTGGAHRVGRALATALARRGYAVHLHYWKSNAAAESTATEIKRFGVPVFLSRADLSAPESIKELFSEIDHDSLPLKALVNSAGIMRRGDPRDLTARDWDETMDLNLRAPFLCAQEAAARMVDGGLIVNITDVGASKAWSGFPSYTVSKAGLEALTRVLARAFSPNIRVNAIAPALVLRSAGVSDEDWSRLVGRIPLKRPATPEEIAAALDFLLSNEYVTGQTIVVDGGYSLLG